MIWGYSVGDLRISKMQVCNIDRFIYSFVYFMVALPSYLYQTFCTPPPTPRTYIDPAT